jgi:superfamily II DNA or RNA helicase
MDTENFLRRYKDADLDAENPYDIGLYESINTKREFRSLEIEPDEPFPEKQGQLLKHQLIDARYMSPYSPYTGILVFKEMGTGKCVHPDSIIKIDGEDVRIEDLYLIYTDKDTLSPLNGESEWVHMTPGAFPRTVSCSGDTIAEGVVSKLYREFVDEEIVTYIMSDSSRIICTKRHRLLCKGLWLDYTGLQKGYPITSTTSKGEMGTKVIVSIVLSNYRGWVYDLEVDEYHNYLCNELFTHNTCSAIGSVELALSQGSTINKALVLASGDKIHRNIRQEILEKCTPKGKYKVSDKEYITYKDKMRIASVYSFSTFQLFPKLLANMSEDQIRSKYNNHYIIIDEVHNIKEKGDTSVYATLHRFLHIVQNCKVILMTGTPIRDRVEEIAAHLNLILPLDRQIKQTSHKDFMKYFMKLGDDGVYRVRDGGKRLKKYLKGYVTYLRAPRSAVTKVFGSDIIPGLLHFPVDSSVMSEFQSEHYYRAYAQDTKGERKKTDVGDGMGVYNNSLQASMFVFPNGEYKTDEYVKKKTILKDKSITGDTKVTYSLDNRLVSALKNGGDTLDNILRNLEKYSAKYAAIIKAIMKDKGSVFVYGKFTSGGGLVLLSHLLNLFGYSRSFGGPHTTKAKRFALVTGKVGSAEVARIIETYNDPNNLHGEYIHVIFGSKTISEGISLRNVQSIHVVSPHWNRAELDQSVARGLRYGSHRDLLEETGVTPVVRIYYHITSPIKNGDADHDSSVEVIMARIAQNKDLQIKSVERAVKESAIDCLMTKKINRAPEAVDFSRECEYLKCDYTCDSVMLNKAVTAKGYLGDDSDMYHMYYGGDTLKLIIEELENIFRDRFTLNLEEILAHFETLKENTRSGDDISKSRADAIALIDEYMVISALRDIISGAVRIKDRYGFYSYLHEHNDTYFISTTTTVSGTSATFYATNPPVGLNISYEDIVDIGIVRGIPDIFDALIDVVNGGDKKEAKRLMEHIPLAFSLQVLKVVVESLYAKAPKSSLRDWYLEFYKESLVLISEGKSVQFKENLSKEDRVLIRIEYSDPGVVYTGDKRYALYEGGNWVYVSEKERPDVFAILERGSEYFKHNPFKFYGIVKDNSDFYIRRTASESSTEGKGNQLTTGNKCPPYAGNGNGKDALIDHYTVLVKYYKKNKMKLPHKEIRSDDLRRKTMRDICPLVRELLDGAKYVEYVHTK